MRPEVDVQVQREVKQADVAPPQVEAPRAEDPLTVQQLADPLADPLVGTNGLPAPGGNAAPAAPAAPSGPGDASPLQMLTSVTGTITGHASPRWESPGTGETAEGNNQALSEQRAAAVREEFIRLFDERMGDDVDYQLSARCSDVGDGEGGEECPIEQSGAGDAVTTEEAGGDPSANERQMRRVAVSIQVRHDNSREECEETWDVQEEGADQVSGDPSRCTPNHTTDWSVKVQLSAGVHIVGGAAVLVVTLRNNRTGQQSSGLITGVGIGGGIGGGGSGDVTESESDWATFHASLDGEPVTFNDFNHRMVIFGGLGASVVGGYGGTTMRIPALTDGPINLHGFQLGLGASVSANLGGFAEMSGPERECERPEYEMIEGEECRSVMDTETRSYSAQISFGTESADLDEQAMQMLTTFVDRVATDVRSGDSAGDIPCDESGTDFHCGG